MRLSSDNGNNGKWTQPIHNWGTTLAELSLYFEEQLRDELA